MQPQVASSFGPPERLGTAVSNKAGKQFPMPQDRVQQSLDMIRFISFCVHPCHHLPAIQQTLLTILKAASIADDFTESWLCENIWVFCGRKDDARFLNHVSFTGGNQGQLSNLFQTPLSSLYVVESCCQLSKCNLSSSVAPRLQDSPRSMCCATRRLACSTDGSQ